MFAEHFPPLLLSQKTFPSLEKPSVESASLKADFIGTRGQAGVFITQNNLMCNVNFSEVYG
ncbi:hypothetical protein ABK905_25785 [Acerihabitans sp. KWT182]|uniref:Uncharacterized protein n=1 Tax=Acerihabitans sp. KWT182 TaxID=3157919 RepID=A0AAU7QBT1_9GAMM